MGATAAITRYTPDDLLLLPDGKRFELVDGQLVERTMSAWSDYVAGRLFKRVENHCEAASLGWVFPEGASYRCFADAPDRVRKADASFIGRERLSFAQATARGHLTVVPDWVGEVLSPNDLVYNVDEKVQEFLNAGVRLLWVANPQARTVQVHRLRGAGTILRENDALDGEDVMPGFRCRVGELFLPPAGVTVGP
jgi:Uma2 family endonuclease